MTAFKTTLISMVAGCFALFFTGAYLTAKAAPLCIPVEKLTEIAINLKMVVLWQGQGRSGETYAIYANKDGIWDAVVIMPDMSKACIVAEGGNSKLLSTGM